MNDSNPGPRRVSDASTSGDSGIGRLLRLAGHRTQVPARDAEIVKQAARWQWLRTVRAQRRRAWTARGGGLLAAAAMVLLVLNTDLGPARRPVRDPVATVVTVSGPARASTAERGPVRLAAGVTLRSGTVVETAARDAVGGPARAAFRLADGISLRLDAGTRVRLLAGRVIDLERGAVYADSGPDAPRSAGSLEIRTPLGIARDIGTQFEVRLGGADPLEVRVREGEVTLDRDGEVIAVRAGFALAVHPDGSVIRTPTPGFGPSWDWILGALPAFDTEGRTLRELLAWAARESGWRLRFADPALAVEIADIAVHGSVAGLTPEEAAGGFLIASGLGYRLEDGVFVIEPGT